MSVAPGYRGLPSVDRLLGHPEVRRLLEGFPHQAVVEAVRGELEGARAAVALGATAPTADALAGAVSRRARELWRPRPGRLINATGVIVHTNLGRAPLSPEALEAVRDAAVGYSDLEMDLASGERGSRQGHLRGLLRQATGAESALVVNNNASAVLLALASLAAGREVVVSRGEAVEIGGGFRVPDVLRQSGAALVEVGTTNRTYLRDYQEAMGPQTAALLRVHASNFRVVGFTHAPGLGEMAELAHRHGALLLHDLGSGCLLETGDFGLAHEPTPGESLAAGADLALFSGDKLLGGPQAGIAVGRAEVVARMERHPLARAVRVDRLSVAALSATLLHYVRGEAVERVPVWRMVSADAEGLRRRAEGWRERLGGVGSVVPGESTVGGGSLPGETLPTYLLSLDGGVAAGGGGELARRLRTGVPAVVGRVHGGSVLLDPRTVMPDEDEGLVSAVAAALVAGG